MSEAMTDEQRQLFNIRVIRVTLGAALRKASSPQVAREAVAQAMSLLDGVRQTATTAQVRSEVDSVRSDILSRVGEPRQERAADGTIPGSSDWRVQPERSEGPDATQA